jgi:hypothetical protein
MISRKVSFLWFLMIDSVMINLVPDPNPSLTLTLTLTPTLTFIYRMPIISSGGKGIGDRDSGYCMFLLMIC